jgi:hypothetical protein
MSKTPKLSVAVKYGKKPACPSFPWPGGKAALSSEIIKYIPKKGSKLIDLFAGRGNISFRAMHEGLQYEEWILNDPLTHRFFMAIKDQGDKFVAAERTKEEYDRCALLAKSGDPYALLMEPFLCYDGGTYEANGMRGDGGGRTAASHTKHVHRACELMREHNVRNTNLDWLDCLKAENPGEDDAVIVDSPYIGCAVGTYSAESICPAELIEHLKDAPFFWIFCEYAQPLYLSAFGEPAYAEQVREFDKRTDLSPEEEEIVREFLVSPSSASRAQAKAIFLSKTRGIPVLFEGRYYMDFESLVKRKGLA